MEVRTKVDDPEVGVEEPEAGAEEPEAELEEPEAGLEEPEAGVEESELGVAWVLFPVVEFEALAAAAPQVQDPFDVTFEGPMAVIIVKVLPSHDKF